MTRTDLIKLADDAFRDVPCPARMVEGYDYEVELYENFFSTNPRENLKAGDPSEMYDSIFLTTHEAFRHLFPVYVQLALRGPEESCLMQLVHQMELVDTLAAPFSVFNDAQLGVALLFLYHVRDNPDSYADEYDFTPGQLDRVITWWEDYITARTRANRRD